MGSSAVVFEQSCLSLCPTFCWEVSNRPKPNSEHFVAVVRIKRIEFGCWKWPWEVIASIILSVKKYTFLHFQMDRDRSVEALGDYGGFGKTAPRFKGWLSALAGSWSLSLLSNTVSPYKLLKFLLLHESSYKYRKHPIRWSIYITIKASLVNATVFFLSYSNTWISYIFHHHL